MHQPQDDPTTRAGREPATTQARRRVLIVATGRDRGALAAARAFRRAGWYVGVGTPEGGGSLGASTACDATFHVPRPRDGSAGFIEGVRRAAEADTFDVVFGGGDDWMAALAAYREQIPVPVAHPDFGVIETILDKLRLARHAEKAGLASPRTELATDEALARWSGPLVVKCKEHWAPGHVHPLRIEAKLFDSPAAARAQVERIRAAGAQAILQEPVDGTLGALIGVFHDGRLLGRTQQVSTRLWPTPNGASARASTVAVDEVLVGKVEAMLLDVGWHGLVELQFLTGHDGVPHLIDFNGRFYGSLALAESARPGLVHTWALSALGAQPSLLADATPGKRYTWLTGDLRRARIERRGGLLRDLAGTLLWSARARHSIWDPRDVGPSVSLALRRFRRP
ncbi:ATP-grasp domain-containing protein [Arthrobacter sp. Ld5]|uniref:ATP-grasp domain-containing protein n=1 Tax=Arthrobacter sp. Ld5 TaxID=649152 RepID=UPI003EBBA47E